jgi:16S rRNA processing protein RimM
MTSINQKAGSPGSGEPAFLVIGKLRRPHGVKGEMLMEVITDFPDRIRPGVTVFVGEGHRPLVVQSCRSHAEGMLIGFEGVSQPESAGELRNALVQVPLQDRPNLPEGDFYHHQILGLRVVDQNGERLGVVTAILETGANDVFAVSMEDGREILIPYTDDTVLSIIPAESKMVVQLLPGLMPEIPSGKTG